VIDITTELFLRVFERLLDALRGEKGQTLVEYGLLLVLIAVVIYLLVKGVGYQTNCLYSTINSSLGDVK